MDLFPELKGKRDGLELVWKLIWAVSVSFMTVVTFLIFILVSFRISIFSVWTSSYHSINILMSLLVSLLYVIGWYLAGIFFS